MNDLPYRALGPCQTSLPFPTTRPGGRPFVRHRRRGDRESYRASTVDTRCYPGLIGPGFRRSAAGPPHPQGILGAAYASVDAGVATTQTAIKRVRPGEDTRTPLRPPPTRKTRPWGVAVPRTGPCLGRVRGTGGRRPTAAFGTALEWLSTAGVRRITLRRHGRRVPRETRSARPGAAPGTRGPPRDFHCRGAAGDLPRGLGSDGNSGLWRRPGPRRKPSAS